MRIEDVCPAAPGIEDKLLDKHGVTMWEVAYVLRDATHFRRLGLDDYGEMRYRAVGRTDAGRWLTVIFVVRGQSAAYVLSARDATDRERRSAAKG